MFFSEYFGIDSSILEKYGAVDISFVCDSPLFIDPMLIFTYSFYYSIYLAMRITNNQ